MWILRQHAVARVTMDPHPEKCVHCGSEFHKRKGRGHDKRSLSGKLRNTQGTVYSALKEVFLYDVSIGPCLENMVSMIAKAIS